MSRDWNVVAAAILSVPALCFVVAGSEPVRRTSPLGEEALSVLGRRAVRAETRHFTTYGSDEGTVNWVGQVADSAFELADRWLRGEKSNPLPSERERLILFVFEEADWSRVVNKSDLRDDGLGMQWGNELYIQEGNTRGETVLRVAHEVAHERLRRHFQHLPVWLEEGVASMLGWDVAQALRTSRGWTLVRAQASESATPTCLREDIVRWSSEYPAQSKQAAHFQRCTEVFARALHRELGYGNFIEYLRAVSSLREPWDGILRDQFSFSDKDFERLDKALQRMTTEP